MVADRQLGGVGDHPLSRYRRRHAIHFVDVKVCEGPKELKNKELFSCLGRYSSSCPSSFSTLKSMMAPAAAARQSTSTVLVWSRIRRVKFLTGHWRRCAVHLIFTCAMRLHLRTGCGSALFSNMMVMKNPRPHLTGDDNRHNRRLKPIQQRIRSQISA